MSRILNIKEVLTRMLKSEDSNVISLSGNWGIGKSHFWNNYIKNKSIQSLVSRKKYSYVSLFGINSLEELKQAIFERTVPISEAGKRITFKNYVDNLKSPITEFGGLWRSFLSYVSGFPGIKSFAPLAFKGLYLTVQDTLICLDDLERKGENLRIQDVLGLVSELKEQRNCQIILISNTDQLTDFEEYKRFSEKVIDYGYLFEQELEDVLKIGLPKEKVLHDYYQEIVSKLQLKNIRVIKKLDHFDKILSEMCEDYHKDIYREAAASLPLLIAVKFASDNENIPDYTFLKKRNKWSFMGDNEPEGDEKRFESLLDDYGWSHFDDLDDLIYEMIDRGYPDKNKIRAILAERNELYSKGVRKQVINDVWKRYKSSLTEDEDTLINDMIGAYTTNIEVTNPGDINSIVWLLRSLERDDEADHVIDLFLGARADWIKSPDRDNDFRYGGERELDARLLDGINQLISSIQDHRSLEEVMDKFVLNNSYGRKDQEYLGKITEDDFFDFFSKANNGRLPGYVEKVLEFTRYDGDPVLKAVGETAKRSLQRMLGQSRLTDIKLKQMGLTPD